MGDILGAIFGTSSSTEQETVPDAIQQETNRQLLNQLVNFFQTGGGINQFAGGGGDAYNPTNFSTDISNIARNNLLANQNIDPSNMISMEDYRRSFDPVTGTYTAASDTLNNTADRALGDVYGTTARTRADVNAQRDTALQRSYGDYAGGVDRTGETYQRGTNDIDSAYNDAIARGDYDLARQLSTNTGFADRALATNEGIFQRNLGLIDDTSSQGLGTNEANYLRSLDINEGVTGRGLDRNNANLLRSLGLVDSGTNRSLTTQDANRARAIELGVGATGNYIDQIATPRLNAALALQGLESGGAVPAAIARATAEHALPYLQSIEGAYSTNQANTLNNATSLRGSLSSDSAGVDAQLINALLSAQTSLGGQKMSLDASQIQALLAARAQLAGQHAGLQSGVNTTLQGVQSDATQSAAEGNRQLGGQRLGAQASLASNYQNNVNQLAQALMANNISLEQAGIDANSALGQGLVQAQTTLRGQQQQGLTSLATNYGSNAASFAQSLPGAASTITNTPLAARNLQAGYLNALQPLADFPRQLSEADYLRRQNLFTTLYTGTPSQTGSTTFGGNATGNIFDQLGGTIQSGARGGGNIGGA